MTKVIHGKIHGKTIELTEDLGLAEGQEVEIRVKAVPILKQWGEGLRRCAGAFASDWTEEDDKVLKLLHDERKDDKRPEILE